VNAVAGGGLKIVGRAAGPGVARIKSLREDHV